MIMFDKILKPIALFRISSEEFYYKRSMDPEIVYSDIEYSLILLMFPIEIAFCYYIGHFWGPFHLNFIQGGLVILVLYFLNSRIAKLIIKPYKHNRYAERLYEELKTLTLEKRKYFYSWRFRLFSLGISLFISIGFMCLSFLLVPKLFPK